MMHDPTYAAVQQTAQEARLIRQMTRFALLAVEFGAIARRHGGSVTGQTARQLEAICRRQVALINAEYIEGVTA